MATSSRSVPEIVTELGGRPVRTRVGHSYIKAEMAAAGSKILHLRCVEYARRFGVPLRQGYGLTEASPVCLFNTPDRPARPGTLGVEIPRVRVEIHDAAGRPLPAGEVGELCVQGENVFSGYLDGDPHGAPRDGWLRTGDLATRDEEGFVRFVGLLKPMFTRSGFNVYPREIERVLEEDPRVSRAIVTAQPDTARENEVILEVEVADASLTADEVKELCRTRLAAYKQPGRIVLR